MALSSLRKRETLHGSATLVASAGWSAKTCPDREILTIIGINQIIVLDAGIVVVARRRHLVRFVSMPALGTTR